MRRAVRLTLGNGLPFQIFPDGRVLVTLPPTMQPFGAALAATALYPNLKSFLAAMRRDLPGQSPFQEVAMRSKTKPSATENRAPHVGPCCRKCGHLTILSPCTQPGCDGWAGFCWGCPAVVELFAATDGRCERCRVQ